MKKARGVYYTPPPVVNFIVRAVDDILKETFSIAQGLADYKRVTVLDFACGPGTFILEVLERIFDHTGGADSAKASLIAHLKLSQYLADKGRALGDGQRLQVFLTNTLEPQKNFILPELTKEIEAAQRVKD